MAYYFGLLGFSGTSESTAAGLLRTCHTFDSHCPCDPSHEDSDPTSWVWGGGLRGFLGDGAQRFGEGNPTWMIGRLREALGSL